VGSNARFRYSYSGSGWSVRLVDPAKTEPKRDARQIRPFALVVGACALVCIVAGFAILSQRAPQLDQPPAAKASREDFIVPSPVIPADMVGSIPGMALVAPATPEPNAAAEFSPPEPEPTGETVNPSPREKPTAGADSARAQSGVAIRRAVQRPRELRGQVARIVLSSGSGGDAESAPINSPVVVAPGQQKRVVLYTELRHLAGQTVSHRWERRGQTMAVIPFKVKGDRWRVHSSKTLTPALKGSWQVVVTDSQGAILAGKSFVVR
jgi:Protein of unknown function (DUF2914)